MTQDQYCTSVQKRGIGGVIGDVQVIDVPKKNDANPFPETLWECS